MKMLNAKLRQWIAPICYKYFPQLRKNHVRRILSKVNVISGDNFNQDKYKKMYKKIKNNYRVIRLHQLRSDRIGEYIARYLTAVEDSERNKKHGILDVFVLSDYVNHNSRLSRIMGRNIHIVDESNLIMWERILNCFPRVELIKYWNDYVEKKLDKVLYSKNTLKYFKFTEEEEEESNKKKELMELRGSYVCASSRDGVYLNTIFPTLDCTYHDYRDSDINKFNLSAEYLSDKKIITVRMGRYVQDKVNFNNCIDYSNKYYDELMDMILPRDCKFFVGDSCGLLFVPMVLNCPIALKNMVPVFLDSESFPYNPSNLFIFKKYYSTIEDRFLSIREMMKIEKECKYDGHKYEEQGIEMIENSAKEIMDLVVEMNERLDGKWIETPEDIELQKKYQMIYKEWWEQEKYPKGAMMRMRVGTMFLRENLYLLN